MKPSVKSQMNQFITGKNTFQNSPQTINLSTGPFSEINSTKTQGPRPFNLSEPLDKKLLFKSITKVYHKKTKLEKSLLEAKNKIKFLEFKKNLSRILSVGLYSNGFESKLNKQVGRIKDIEEKLMSNKIELDFQMDHELLIDYQNLVENYFTILKTEKSWDIDASFDSHKQKSLQEAETSLKRRQIFLCYEKPDYIKCKQTSLHFQNSKGFQLFIFPGFAISLQNGKIDFIDINDLEINCKPQIWTERGAQAFDAKVLKTTWKKTKANGKRDENYNINPMVPICKYGRLSFSTPKGLHLNFLISNIESTEDFVHAFQIYKENLYQYKAENLNTKAAVN